MTEQELREKRRAKWRLDGRAVRTLEDARDFLESVGFALMYPLRAAPLLPTFMGATVGSDERLPSPRQAFNDPRAKTATELMVRLLREKSAYEANLFPETNFLVAASVFPYYYALLGERNPKQGPNALGPRAKVSPLSRDAFALIQREGPVSKRRMLQALGGAISDAALDRALDELWSKLRITRVDYSSEQGSSWDVLYRWSPEAVNEGVQLSVPEALSALVSKYLDAVVAAEQEEIDQFFGALAPRSKVREAVNAMIAAREFAFVPIGHRSMVQVTPPRVPYTPRPKK